MGQHGEYIFIDIQQQEIFLARIIFKCGKDIHCPEISDKFDYGGSASLNMRIMDHLMR